MMKRSKFQGIMISMTGSLAIMLSALLSGCGAADIPADQLRDAAAAGSESRIAADIVIEVSGLSEKPSFFPVEVNGTDMEIIALTAPDGTVRTAFNTCQICYSSGRGYYRAELSELVCQNCGNRFAGDEVGVSEGGCNPVPILQKDRSEKDGFITVSGRLLAEAAVIFQNWK